MSEEADPSGRAAHLPGSKLDAGKAPVMRGVIRYFPRALAAVAYVSECGARKYAWNGWETVPDGQDRYADARGRHELALGRGEWSDDGPNGTGQPHLAQVAWNALAELELRLRQREAQAALDSVSDDAIHRSALASVKEGM